MEEALVSGSRYQYCGRCAGGCWDMCWGAMTLLSWGPRVMSVASVGSGEGEYGGGRLPAVIPPSASLSISSSDMTHRCAVWPWPSYLASLCFSFLNCQMLPTLRPARWEIEIKRLAWKVFRAASATGHSSPGIWWLLLLWLGCY